MLDSLRLRIGAFLFPNLRDVFADPTGWRRMIESQARATGMLEAHTEMIESFREAAERELKETAAIAGAGPQSKPLKENWLELQQQLDSVDWTRQIAWSTREFSRYGIQQLILICRLYFLKNPLIHRSVHVSSNYVFGRGYEISSDDKTANETIQAFLKANSTELGMLGLVEKDQTLRTDGNLYFILFTGPTTGDVVIRTIDAAEISDIISDPDDVSRPRFYKRLWQQQMVLDDGTVRIESQTAWYPALGYFEAEAPGRKKAFGGGKIYWDSPVYHVKVGGLPKWRFGLPQVYAQIDWAQAYRTFLESWHSVNEALARFAWKAETKGGPGAIKAWAGLLNTTVASDDANYERNPAPVAGSTFVSGPNDKMTPMRTSGAAGNPEQGRRIMLMVAAASGLPETFFGDASVGTVATAQSLDRPTELQFLLRQELWREVLSTILQYVIQRSKGAPAGSLREADTPADAVQINVFFPAILERDVGQVVDAIVSGTTLNGYKPAGTVDMKTASLKILQALGIDNAKDLVDLMYPDASYSPEQPDPAEVAAAAAAAVPPPGGRQPSRKQLSTMGEAIKRLTDSIKSLKGST